MSFRPWGECHPSQARTFVRPWAAPDGHPGMTLYYEVCELGTLVVRAESRYDDHAGELRPVTMSLRNLAILDRLAEMQTPVPPPDPETDPSS